jgi:hypothetical protein
VSDEQTDDVTERGERPNTAKDRDAQRTRPRRQRATVENPAAAVSSVSRILLPIDQGDGATELMAFDLLVRTLYHQALFARDRKAQADLLGMRRTYQRQSRSASDADIDFGFESQEPVDEEMTSGANEPDHGEAPGGHRQRKIIDEGRRETFDRISALMMDITDGQNVRRVTMQKALWIVLYADAIGGDAKARKLLVRFMDSIDRAGVEPRPDYIDEDGDWIFTLNIGDKKINDG